LENESRKDGIDGKHAGIFEALDRLTGAVNVHLLLERIDESNATPASMVVVTNGSKS
jgi:hypothetical protein